MTFRFGFAWFPVALDSYKTDYSRIDSLKEADFKLRPSGPKVRDFQLSGVSSIHANGASTV
jgi:hypothetical protein